MAGSLQGRREQKTYIKSTPKVFSVRSTSAASSKKRKRSSRAPSKWPPPRPYNNPRRTLDLPARAAKLRTDEVWTVDQANDARSDGGSYRQGLGAGRFHARREGAATWKTFGPAV